MIIDITRAQRITLLIIGCLIMLHPNTNAQNKTELTGTWVLQYTMRAGDKPCSGPINADTLILQPDGAFQEHWAKVSLLGEWYLKDGKLFMVNCRPVGYEGGVMDRGDPVTLKDSLLNIRLPEKGDIPCFNQFFKRL